MKKVMLILAFIMTLTGCISNVGLPSSETHYGGAILLDDSGEVPTDLYTDSGIYNTDEHGDFTKVMDVYGIKFIAKDDIPDEFMRKVANAYKEMFAVNEDTNTKMQEKVIENLYKYKALLPIVSSERDVNGKEITRLQNENSICDIIMYTNENQAMEVVEHLMHTVTDVGLSYAMRDEWGFDEDSTVSQTMKRAIDNGFYDISSYNFGDSDVKNRVLVQEYAYWIITSYWDIQQKYGLGEDEWKLDSSQKMTDSLNDAKDLIENSLTNVLYPISADTLSQLEYHQGEEINAKITNDSYVEYIDIDDIERDVSILGNKYKAHFDKYIQYIAPNGKPITILAQDKVSDEQLLKAYNILSFYLVSYADYDMDLAANQMANNQAVLVMPNGADGDKLINMAASFGQPLYAMETPVTGDDWYIKNDYEHRDASYEEILHLVHDYGIGTTLNVQALPELANEINKATFNSLPEDKSEWGKSGIWGLGFDAWLQEISKEGSLEQEYIVSVVDSYYGLWEAFQEAEGGMWGGYIAKNREEIAENDPMGYKALESFLPKQLTYMDRISPNFEGTFYVELDEGLPYTYKSQYLLNIRLTGTNDSNIVGNKEDNIFIPNSGTNHIDGKEGYDIIHLQGASYEYNIEYASQEVIITDKSDNRDGLIRCTGVELLRFTDEDIVGR